MQGTINGFDSETISPNGKKPFTVHKVNIDGTWYECGYKKPAGFGPGDVVSFDAEKRYGKMSLTTPLSRATGGGSSSTPPADTAKPAPSRGGYGGGVAKEFPVPMFHPDRSIIRQNSLAHATELYVNGQASTLLDLQAAAEQIIELAYKFEEYATGQREVRMANEEPNPVANA